jgi:kinesin family member 11
MGVLIESVVREAREYMDAERKAALDAKSFASAAADVEVARLREQNTMLTQLLESERAKNERAQVELLQRIAGLLSEFAAGRDQGWRDAVQKVKEANVRSESKLVEFGERHGRTMDEMVERAGNASKIAEKRCVEGRKSRDAALTVRIVVYCTRTTG